MLSKGELAVCPFVSYGILFVILKTAKWEYVYKENMLIGKNIFLRTRFYGEGYMK